MTVTTTSLVKAAGAAAAVAGGIFIAVQVNHPPHDAFTTETTQWVARSCAKMVMSVLALAGITGMYLRQHTRMGVLGLTGYLLFAVGYLSMFATQVIAAVVLPQLVDTQPGFVNDVVASAVGAVPEGDIGSVQLLFNVTGVGYMLGGLVFGIALVRSGVLARWAAALLAVSTVATASLAFLPEAFDRPMAVPEAIALIGLGVSLWRSTGSTPAVAPVRRTPVAESVAR
ncbi:hypothetical protein [Nocardioides taihuensis]|uniref:DUF4386 family protein n=1 Tax=Nocardioides taihuensis TaxID=1835606 RepID=A0ABW0BE11_9ACTN